MTSGEQDRGVSRCADRRLEEANGLTRIGVQRRDTPTPGVFLQRVWICLKTQEIVFCSVQTAVAPAIANRPTHSSAPANLSALDCKSYVPANRPQFPHAPAMQSRPPLADALPAQNSHSRCKYQTNSRTDTHIPRSHKSHAPGVSNPAHPPERQLLQRHIHYRPPVLRPQQSGCFVRPHLHHVLRFSPRSDEQPTKYQRPHQRASPNRCTCGDPPPASFSSHNVVAHVSGSRRSFITESTRIRSRRISAIR